MSATKEKARIFLVDDHPAVRHGLARLLGDEMYEVCGEKGSLSETLEAIVDSQADLAIVDLSLGEESGFDLIAELSVCKVPVLVYSMHEDASNIDQSLRAGASGYVSKREESEVLCLAVQMLLDIERDRVLSEDEIKALRKQLPKAGMSDSAVTAVWLALATCCRISELTAARWEHLDLDRRTWRIPPENSKNKKAHTIALSEFALAHFQSLKGMRDEAAAKAREHDPKVVTSPWVYPNRNGTGPVCPKTITKQLGDRQRAGLPPMKGRAKVELSDTLTLIGGRWGPHDLRRTGATMIVALGCLPEVAERCLNHTEENRVKRIYQRHSYESEMREAWRLLGDRLALLTSADAGNVIVMGRSAA